MQNFKSEEVYNVIMAIDRGRGTMFSAVNVKKDGTLRKWSCRLGVTSNLQGGQPAYDPSEKNVIIVFDPNASDTKPRALCVSTLIYLRVRGTVLVESGERTEEYYKALNLVQ